ncbi:MAG: hypothetical protein KDK25_11235 [Leptospiraceae bacterium]|nr:hypothetical protein [Leptospiraceae bacterium]
MSQSQFDASLWKEIQTRQEQKRSNLAPVLKERKKEAKGPAPKEPSASRAQEASATEDGPPAIRSRIFDDELKAATEQVMEHDASDPLPALASLAGAPPADPAFRHIVSLHNRPVIEAQDFTFLLQHIARTFSADALVVEPLDSMGNSFRPAIHLNVDEETLGNLYFSVRDRYVEPGGWIQLALSEFTNRDPFLRKRFSEEFLKKHRGMAVYHDGHRPYPMLLLLFFKEGQKQEFDEKVVQEMQDCLRNIRPLVFDMAHSYSFAEDRRILQKAFRTTRKFLRSSHPAERWIVNIQGVREHPGRQAFFDRMKELISAYSGLLGIRTGVAEVFIFHCRTAPGIEQELRSLAREFGFRLNIQSYPLEYRADKQNNALLLLLDPEKGS